MTSSEPFSFDLPISAAEREQAIRDLQVAYAQGRLELAEYDRRIAQANTATTRPDFDAATAGLLMVGAPYQSPEYAVYTPPTQPSTQLDGSRAWSFGASEVATAPATRGRGLATFAHLSPFFAWLIGPALCYAVATPGGFARREAAKAFNFQLVAFITMVSTSIVGGVLGLGRLLALLLGLGALGWFVLTLMGGLKAAQGIDWRNPVMRLIRWTPLDEN